MRYSELWYRLLNAELDAAAREALRGQLRAVLGPSAPRLDDGFFARQRTLLDAARALWVGAGQRSDALLRQPLLDASAGAAAGPLIDALLAPGSQRGPTRRDELDRLLQRALVHGASQYLFDLGRLGEPARLPRCEGLRPGAQGPWEDRPGFAALAPAALVQAQLGGEDLSAHLRCAQLFTPQGKGRFCSRACRDRNHALARRRRDPRYDAQRQARYRARQARPDPEPAP